MSRSHFIKDVRNSQEGVQNHDLPPPFLNAGLPFTFSDAFSGGNALISLLEAAQEVFTSEGREDVTIVTHQSAGCRFLTCSRSL